MSHLLITLLKSENFALSHAHISIYYLWQCFDYAMIHMCDLCLISSLLTLDLAYLRSSCRWLYALSYIPAFSPWFIHCQQGGEEVRLMQIQKRWAKIWKFASTCSGGACICSGGVFLLFLVWSLCFARLVTFLCFLWFWSWVELLCFSFFFLSFSEFHFAFCVVNALSKAEIEDQERLGGRWMTAP
jgi:hypothetical protein